jgi:hypothetical protein
MTGLKAGALGSAALIKWVAPPRRVMKRAVME